MDVRLVRIVHRGEERPPLHVVFEWNGDEHAVDVDAAAIQSFGQFQRVVANRLGLFVRCEDVEAGGRKAALIWGDDVQAAFERGRCEG